MKDERKERESLLEDFKSLGLKNTRLEDELKGKKGNPNKRIKLTKNAQRELEEAQKQTEEQWKLTKYWKGQARELRGKMAEERQAWENKYEVDTKEHSQEITKLKFKLRVERIERVELRVENQVVQNAIRFLEQSLEEHKDYIIEPQEDSVRQIVEFDKALIKAWRDKEDWRA